MDWIRLTLAEKGNGLYVWINIDQIASFHDHRIWMCDGDFYNVAETGADIYAAIQQIRNH